MSALRPPPMTRETMILAARSQGIPLDKAEAAADKLYGPRSVPVSPSSDSGESRNRGAAMNKTETRRAVELAALCRAGAIRAWHFNAVTLKLADDCRYTPDFLIEYHDGRLEFEEIKGFWRDDARVKIKVAARLFPMFTFTALRARKKREGGGWTTEAF